jgi:putative acetyltransferase
MAGERQILIRPQQPADDAGVFTVNERAFGRPDEARLVEKLRQAQDAIPELSLVAVVGGQIVGHVLFSLVTLETAQGPTPVLSLAPMAVLPEFQNQGIGSILARHGLAEARRLGYSIMVVLGHPNYYPRFGFSRSTDYGIRCAYEVPEEAFMAMPLQPGALDGMQGMVRYPPVFDGV